MLKLIISISLAFMFSLGHLFDEGVSIIVRAPQSVQAGQEFVVEVILNKGSLNGFSRYLQDLPEGLTASADSTVNAEFSFEENKVRVIWIKLPAEKEIMVRYHVAVNENLKGSFKIGGKFSYIENNDRKIIDIAEQSITIIPSPMIDPSLLVDISAEPGKNTIASSDTSAKGIQALQSSVVSPYQGNVVCIRQKPEKSSSGSTAGYKVNVLVHKGKMEKYLKVEEQIPEGFTAVALETESGMFTTDGSTAKFLWIQAPDKPDFIISYMLLPKDPKNTLEPVVKGDLSYIVNNKSYVSQIVGRNENLKQLNKTDLQKLIAKVSNENRKIKSTTVNSNYRVTASENTKAKKYIQRHKESFPSFQLEPENGVYFRVQVAAGHRPISTRSYFRRMRITEDIKTEEHDGWYKYSIGSFKEYQAARDFRVRIWNTTWAKDAFICAYNNGSRVTVQEALMISNQSWLR